MDQLHIEKNLGTILNKIDRLVKRLELDASITITDDIDNIIRKLKRGKYIVDAPCIARNNVKHNKSTSSSKLGNKNSSNSNKVIRKIVTLDWELLISDVLKCISMGIESYTYPNQLLNLIENERKAFKTQEDLLIKNEKIRLLEDRNDEPILKGIWRREPHPQRVYEPLSDYTITETISNDEKDKINLFTTLQDGYLGVPYNYDDHQLTQEWIAAFKDKQGKQDMKASEDNIISIQIQKLVESLVDKVYDNYCTDSNVLQGGPVELGPHLKEAPVWGIDCYTRRMIELSIEDHVEPQSLLNSNDVKIFIEKRLTCAINAQAPDKAHNLTNSINYLLSNDQLSQKETAYAKAIAKVISEISIGDNFRIHPKGTGVICTNPGGIEPEQFVCEYLGELYPPYRWCERIDVIKQAQEKYELKPMLPDFYNILLERPRQDPEGYGILFVDASMKANMGSTISHSCDANCQSSIVSRNGKLSIALTTKRHVYYGEEITHDYHCITNSELEWRAAVCLCSMCMCRGSFLHYATEEDLQQILEQNCGPLWRFAQLLKACSEKPLNQTDKEILERHGMKTAALSQTPANWIKKYVAYNLRFIEFERQALPMKLLRPKNGKPSDYDYETADQDARNVMEQRLQSLTCCFSMVNRVLESQKDKSKTEPLNTLTVKEAVDCVWSMLLQLPKLLEDNMLNEEALAKSKKITSKLKSSKTQVDKFIRQQIDVISKILIEKPNTIGNMRNAILDIRDAVFVLKDYENPKARLNLLTDVLVLWAYTNNFSTPTDFIPIKSESLVVHAREIGSNIPCDILGTGNNDKSKIKNKKPEVLSPHDPVFTGKKTYNKQFILSQLLNWFHAPEVPSYSHLLGCCQIPPPAACFGVSEKEYKEEERKYLQSHLNDDKTQMTPWTSVLTKCFSMDISALNLYGSPYLDQALGQVDNINNAITLIGGRKTVNKVAVVDLDGPQFDKLLPPESNNSWVQCEVCNKWRRVPWNVDADQLPDQWECQMNYWDLDKATCASPADEFDASRELTVDCQNLEKVNEDDLEIGTVWDVLCLELLSYFEATIVAVKHKVNGGKKLRFHFLGWEDCFDEWIESNSDRIQRHHLHTEVLEEGVTVKYKTAVVKNNNSKNNKSNKKKRNPPKKVSDSSSSQVYDYAKTYSSSTSSRRSKEFDEMEVVKEVDEMEAVKEVDEMEVV